MTGVLKRRGAISRLLTGRTARMLFGLLVLIEAVFIAESFTSLLEGVASNGGTATDLIILLLMKTPQIVDFALPLVLLIGLFFAIQAARDENELIVCAAAGVPWTQIPSFAISTGALAFVVSLLFSGFVAPLSNFSQRMMFYDLEARRIVEQIVSPGTRNTLRNLQDRTIIATPRAGPDVEHGNLFIFQPDTGEGWRVSQADDWTVEGPSDTDGYSVRLKTFREYAGNHPAGTETTASSGGSLNSALQFATISVRSLELDFRLEQLVQAADLVRRDDEVTLGALVVQSVFAGHALQSRRLGEMLARALLCPFAALLAVAGAAWAGTRAGRYVALPVVAMAVMGGDIIIRTGLADAAEHGWQALLLSAVIALAAALSLPALYIRHRGEAMIAPRRDR